MKKNKTTTVQPQGYLYNLGSGENTAGASNLFAIAARTLTRISPKSPLIPIFMNKQVVHNQIILSFDPALLPLVQAGLKDAGFSGTVTPLEQSALKALPRPQDFLYTLGSGENMFDAWRQMKTLELVSIPASLGPIFGNSQPMGDNQILLSFGPELQQQVQDNLVNNNLNGTLAPRGQQAA